MARTVPGSSKRLKVLSEVSKGSLLLVRVCGALPQEEVPLCGHSVLPILLPAPLPRESGTRLFGFCSCFQMQG